MKKMTKVVLTWDGYDWFTHNQMKQWCRDTFGKNQVGKSRIWTSFYESDIRIRNESEYYKPKCYMTFFFASEKHANWFILRWT